MNAPVQKKPQNGSNHRRSYTARVPTIDVRLLWLGHESDATNVFMIYDFCFFSDQNHRLLCLIYIWHRRFDNALSLKLTNDHPSMRIIHRKVSLILGQWVSKDTKRPVYYALIRLLQDRDMCVKLAASDLLDYGVIGEEGKDLGEDVEDQICLDDINETKL
ncbi:hypothetical protein LXL04_021617 [Taraxacum kok-saghyz]